MNKRKQGQKVEEDVAKYLEAAGFKILQRNYTIRGGEIDLVTSEAEQIVFVEVKSLKNENRLALTETISSKKRQNLIRSCRHWLFDNDLQGADWRIDFVGVLTDGKQISKLQHIKNAIY